MAFVNFKKGLRANLPTTYTPGTFMVTTDECGLYLDIDDKTRIRIGDFQEFASLAALQANTNPSTTALYYVADINCLAKWNGTEYIQINRDTGMTSVEVVGDGNAVTAAAYDPFTRKLTLTMGATYTTAGDVSTAIGNKVGDLTIGDTTHDTVKDYVDAKTSGIATDAALGELSDRVTELEKVDHEHANKAVLDGITEEKVTDWDAAEQNAKDYADELAKNYDASGAAKTVQDNLDAEIERAQAAEKAASDAAAAAMAEAQKKVCSLTAGDNSVTVGGTSTDPTVAVKLDESADNALKLTENGLKVEIGAAPEYTIVKAADSGDYAAVYNLTKDGTIVGASINIPKDMVVESGTVVENPEGQAEGTYIKLVLQNVAEPLYINVGSLIEYVTSGSAAGDMVVINISDDHKVTATITDGSITLAKLTTAIQTAIGKAHSHDNKDVLDGINADKVAAWDAAEQNAKDYADGKDEAIEAARTAADNAQSAADKAQDDVDALQSLVGTIPVGENGQAVAETVIAYVDKKTEGIASDAALSELEERINGEIEALEQAMGEADTKTLEDAKDYADSLAENYDAKGSAEDALADAKVYTDKQITAVNASITWGSF